MLYSMDLEKHMGKARDFKNHVTPSSVLVCSDLHLCLTSFII